MYMFSSVFNVHNIWYMYLKPSSPAKQLDQQLNSSSSYTWLEKASSLTLSDFFLHIYTSDLFWTYLCMNK